MTYFILWYENGVSHVSTYIHIEDAEKLAHELVNAGKTQRAIIFPVEREKVIIIGKAEG